MRNTCARTVDYDIHVYLGQTAIINICIRKLAHIMIVVVCSKKWTKTEMRASQGSRNGRSKRIAAFRKEYMYTYITRARDIYTYKLF